MIVFQLSYYRHRQTKKGKAAGIGFFENLPAF